MWPAWEAALSPVLKTQRSEEPVSKSMLMVCPPIVTGERYSTSPCSGVAVTIPVPFPAVLFVEPAVAPPVDCEATAELVAAAAPFAFFLSSTAAPLI